MGTPAADQSSVNREFGRARTFRARIRAKWRFSSLGLLEGTRCGCRRIRTTHLSAHGVPTAARPNLARRAVRRRNAVLTSALERARPAARSSPSGGRSTRIHKSPVSAQDGSLNAKIVRLYCGSHLHVIHELCWGAIASNGEVAWRSCLLHRERTRYLSRRKCPKDNAVECHDEGAWSHHCFRC